MSRFDRIFLTLILAPVFPVLLFLAGWWGSLGLLPDNRTFIAALTGLAFGIVIDVLRLSLLVRMGYRAHSVLWLLVYTFYSVCFFGFFMGVPVFNLLLGIPAGCFVARRATVSKYPRLKSMADIRAISRISTGYMTLVCIASALIALADPYTALNLKGMFGLPFDVTRMHVVALIVLGGSFLIGMQYALTHYSARLMLGRKVR